MPRGSVCGWDFLRSGERTRAGLPLWTDVHHHREVDATAVALDEFSSSVALMYGITGAEKSSENLSLPNFSLL